ncbi:ER lumen protein-retaining receptor 3 [Zea mays]|uniref:ER lumen protein-retaining receptor 3 n=5 Tax=Zea mays TaxID=4577 RepID=A0A8J8XPM5_MAIZE|nr:ER lumen protein retaining receptor family protein [Zea mays]PWZ58686.1 ER lumen protein-retaining receptor 3 [Zea mays]
MTIVATNRNSCNNPTGLDPTQPNPSITPPAPPPRLSQAPQLRSSRHARTSRSRGRAHPDPDRARRRLRLHRSASGREMRGSSRRPVAVVMAWVRRQPPKVKAFLAVVAGMAALVFIRFIVHDHDNLFVAAEAAHALGIAVLIYKLTKEKTCAGLSLKSQDLTALFLAVRLYCSFVMEYDIHTILDTATLAATLFVIYMIRFKLRSTYMLDKDNFALYYVVLPCAVLALLVHPSTSHNIVNRICWAFCVYLEAVSVLPQLRLMQNTKIVEPFTAHYVFALGVARFLSCAHWVLQVLDTRGGLLTALGYGLWPSMVLLSEIVQTFILADFCYYYVKSVFGGQLVLRLPSGVV